ncbi:hypothetical protein GCM10022223_32940 [Kineosporia mesophila]|uniref:Transposase n=1 Tax=Kineosporia mesophila TaxID=566012 RepID=A0ABP6ZM05_9ACTN|nr:hypothetical protein [Kineosporia mesophila]MCD5353710.1 hypothetical protein [Kineosporia mesophila]
MTLPAGLRLPAAQQRARWDAAVPVVQEYPQINGSDLRVELAAQGWHVSDRTAARILSGMKQGVLVPQG